MAEKYDIFISWHKDDFGKSENIANEIETFIKFIFGEEKIGVFNSASFSSGVWREGIAQALKECVFAIFVHLDGAVDTIWMNFEGGALYMKTLLVHNPIPHENLVVYKMSQIDDSAKGSSAPIKQIQMVAITDEKKVKEYFGRIAKHIDANNEWEQKFDSKWKPFSDNINGFYAQGGKYSRSEYEKESQPVAPHTVPTSIDDISFDSIEFNYKKPEKSNGDIKQFFGRVEFVNTLHDEFAKGNNCMNVVATGGMGKTSVAHRYIEMFGNEYDGRIIFVTSNQDIQNDFNAELRNCLLVNNNGCDKLLLSMQDMNSANVLTKQIVKILGKATKKSLLIIDVNIDQEHLKALDLAGIKESKYWNILYLSRKKIEGAKQNDKFALPNFEDDLEGATGLFNDIYKDNDFDETQLKHLFELVYHHPLLIEQLAAYGARGGKHKSYDDLCDVLGDIIENDATDTENKEGIWLKDKYGHDYNVCSFLKKLISYSDFSEKYQYILRHFVLWQYDYIPLDAINKLLKNDKRQNFENHLSDLVDQMIFSVSDKGYRMHGVLCDVIKKDLKAISDVDYSNYISNVKSLLKPGERIDSDTRMCIRNTPSEIFGIGSTKDYSVYEDWKFLRGLAKLKGTDELSELSYKAYLLKEFYNKSGEEIYNKVYGEYNDVSSHLLYYRWLETRDEYDRPLPQEQTVNGITFFPFDFEGVKFKMIKVSPDYYIAETQVTQELWTKVMAYNPSYFNENRLVTDTSQYPVERVSWYDCMDFIIKLNDNTKLKHFKFNLPTSEEWEYAAYAGERNERFKYSGSDKIDEVAWYDENSQRHTHPVISPEKKPNGLGIHGMSGNVWEWCQDWYLSGVDRFLRGGSWDDLAQRCRVSNRHWFYSDYRRDCIGFRLSLSSNNS